MMNGHEDVQRSEGRRGAAGFTGLRPISGPRLSPRVPRPVLDGRIVERRPSLTER